MAAVEIRKCIMAVPFKPFTLNMSDGRKLPVFGRDFIMISPNGAVIDLFQPDSDHDIIATGAVTGITYIGEGKMNDSNQLASA